MAKKIRVKLVRSTIGKNPNQVATVKALGLRKIGSEVEFEVNASLLGMVETVAHLVVWEDVK
ncbi:MAG: 50S ribosomal protein L30 [Spirochaetales bacterium]|nr:50S ribosomal protein L30 [Spirochaetales bacterium]